MYGAPMKAHLEQEWDELSVDETGSTMRAMNKEI
jgi:hypothetical protein